MSNSLRSPQHAQKRLAGLELPDNLLTGQGGLALGVCSMDFFPPLRAASCMPKRSRL